jgi:hypothetical protein
MFLKKNYNLILFKLLNDLLLILLFFFGVFVLADGVLPGIISNYFKPYVVALLLLTNIVLIFFVGQKIGANVSSKKNKKTALALVFVSALLLFLNFLGINIFLNLFLVLVSLGVGYYIYKVLTEE